MAPSTAVRVPVLSSCHPACCSARRTRPSRRPLSSARSYPARVVPVIRVWMCPCGCVQPSNHGGGSRVAYTCTRVQCRLSPFVLQLSASRVARLSVCDMCWPVWTVVRTRDRNTYSLKWYGRGSARRPVFRPYGTTGRWTLTPRLPHDTPTLCFETPSRAAEIAIDRCFLRLAAGR